MNDFLELINKNLKWQGRGRKWRSFFQSLTNEESMKQLFLDAPSSLWFFYCCAYNFLIAKQCGILENTQCLESWSILDKSQLSSTLHSNRSSPLKRLSAEMSFTELRVLWILPSSLQSMFTWTPSTGYVRFSLILKAPTPQILPSTGGSHLTSKVPALSLTSGMIQSQRWVDSGVLMLMLAQAESLCKEVYSPRLSSHGTAHDYGRQKFTAFFGYTSLLSQYFPLPKWLISKQNSPHKSHVVKFQSQTHTFFQTPLGGPNCAEVRSWNCLAWVYLTGSTNGNSSPHLITAVKWERCEEFLSTRKVLSI